MELLSYDEFSRLHIRHFLPLDEIAEVDTGLEESPLGFFRCLHYFHGRHKELAFYYPASPPVTLAGIDLQVGQHFPADAAQRVLTACAPPLRLGMREHEVTDLLGPPEYSDTGTADYRFRRYRAGSRWLYRLGCGFHDLSGLSSVWIVRYDFYHDEDEV